MGSIEGAEGALALADEAYGRFDVEAVVAHLSSAVRSFTEAGAPCQAAMACARLGDVFANAMGNLTAARAWFARARRLVEDQPPCVEQGWVAVAAIGCDVDDPDELLSAAELALDRARRFGDVNLETKALADAGLAHVQAGRIAQGMAQLDEAMALACGPADEPENRAKSVCSFFTACYYAADFARAGSWTDLLRRNGLIGPEGTGPLFLSSHCDSVQATLLIELGRWGEAEAVLERAKADFERGLGLPSWHAAIALGDLRTRQGRLADAEALLLGKEHHVQALLPAAHLHLARGDHALARSVARRGLRVLGDDRLRAAELLTILVDAELAAGELEAAARACEELAARVAELDVPTLQARGAGARARVLAAAGRLDEAVALVEAAVDRPDVGQLPWLRLGLLLQLARLREQAGDRAGAALDARTAAALLPTLDVVLTPEDAALLDRLTGTGTGGAGAGAGAAPTATLRRDGKWWVASAGGTSVRLHDTKGLRYLAELVARPGVEQHALDLVDRIEGVDPGGIDRRALGDAGPSLDARARLQYRHRIEELRGDIDEALAAEHLDRAEQLQGELDLLVLQLAQSFGLGGRDRRTASAAERARLNVTRALRTAITKLTEALPEAGGALDRAVRTGIYCAFEPADGEIRWIVQS